MLLRAGGLLVAVVLATGALPAAPPLPPAFQKALTECHLVYTAPAGWKPVPVQPNALMRYEYALQHPTRKVELRYAISPLTGLVREYEAARKKGEIAVHPNRFYETNLQSVLWNVLGDDNASMQVFEPAAARREFGADWGASSLALPNPDFAPGYKYCLVVALHKDDRADVYCFFLAASRADLEPDLRPALHALRFR